MNCLDCGKDVTWAESWHEVQGFERKRDGGGTNAIQLREPTGRVLCDSCLVERKHGKPQGEQGSLV